MILIRLEGQVFNEKLLDVKSLRIFINFVIKTKESKQKDLKWHLLTTRKKCCSGVVSVLFYRCTISVLSLNLSNTVIVLLLLFE